MDYFRGVAVLLVFIGHFNDSIPFFSTFGGLGVDLFFVLSGFLVSNYLITKTRHNEHVSYTAFIARRAFKILPSYYFFLLIGYIISYVFTRPVSPEQLFTLEELPQYLFFYRNYGGLPARLTFEHVWSLCVEEHFYLILPLLFIFSKKLRIGSVNWLILITSGIIVVGILIKISAWVNLFAEHPTYTHNRIDALAWGVLLSLLMQSEVLYKLNKTACFSTGLLLFVVSIAIKNFTSFEFYWYFYIHTVTPIAFTLMIAGAYSVQINWLFPLRIIAYFSYNLYLWHFLILIPVKHYFGDGLFGFVVYTTVSVVLTIISTLGIEEPALRLRKKFIQ